MKSDFIPTTNITFFILTRFMLILHWGKHAAKRNKFEL